MNVQLTDDEVQTFRQMLHDYLDGDFPPHGEFGVRSAVDAFFGRAGLTVHATLADRPWISWFVPIPGQARWP